MKKQNNHFLNNELKIHLKYLQVAEKVYNHKIMCNLKKNKTVADLRNHLVHFYM